tara:strand:+ start:504 stop:908 length:405 start_codon:yes stop_codon:yes gene_type:complete
MENSFKGVIMFRRDEFNYCKNKSCGKELKPVKVPRTKGKLCADCRGDAQSDNTLLRRQFIEDQNNPTIPGDDELMFEDCPTAVKEKDHQRYFHKPRTTFSNGSSELGEIMSETVYNSRRIKAKDKYEKIKGENI